MDTRWKNTIRQTGEAIRENKRLLAAIPMLISAVVLLFILYWRATRMYVTTAATWAVGIAANGILAGAIMVILQVMLERIYSDWKPENSEFYISWKETLKRQNSRLSVAAGIFMVMALIFLITQVRNESRFYFYNFALGYLLVATVIFQYALIKKRINAFMEGKLDELMSCVDQINRKRLMEAVEKEKESMEREAKSEQLKVDLISNVSHDLKTPLTSMVGYLELLKKEELDPAARDYVDVIAGKTEKLKEMIESLFSLAKASSGNMQFNLEAIELNRLIEQIFADMDDRIRESGLEFVKSFTEEDSHLVTDNLQMYRICQNLIENALKYSAAGTRIFVRTFVEERLTGRGLCLEVINTSAYPMDFSKEEIVERFVRGDKARTGDGNGLGLAIVSTYADALGGSFDISINCDQFKAALYFPCGEV